MARVGSGTTLPIKCPNRDSDEDNDPDNRPHVAAAECEGYDVTIFGAVSTTRHVSNDNENSKLNTSLHN